MMFSQSPDLSQPARGNLSEARLATFDRRIQPAAINGGKKALEIIPVS